MTKPLDDHSPETLAAQRARFIASGGKVQIIPDGVGVDAIMSRKEAKAREGKAMLGEKPKRAVQGAAFKIKSEYEKHKDKKEAE